MRCSVRAGDLSADGLPVLPFVQSVSAAGDRAAAGPCDPASLQPALLPPTAAIGAAFGSAGGVGTLSCQVSICHVVLRLRVI